MGMSREEIFYVTELEVIVEVQKAQIDMLIKALEAAGLNRKVIESLLAEAGQ